MSLKTRLIAAGASGAVLTAALLIAPGEGEVRTTYHDKVAKTAQHPLGVPTACFGETGMGVQMGQTYTAEQCAEMLAARSARNLTIVDRCAPGLPDRMRVAYADIVHNVGETAFCESSMARLAKQRDYTGSCRAILLYKYVGTKDCSIAANKCGGIWKRRQHELAICEGREPLP